MSRLGVHNDRLRRAGGKLKEGLRKPLVVLGSMHRACE
jgi:hypothetical protein